MVRNTALGEIIGADALVAHTCADLAAAHSGNLRIQLLLLNFIELGGQHTHTFFPVLQLTALLLAGHHDARGLVDQPDGRGGLVDVLAAGAAGPVDLHFDIAGVDLHVHLFHFRQNRNGCSRGVDAAAGFGLRYALDTVHTGFVLHPGVCAPAVNDKIRFLDTAKLRFVIVH